MVRSLKLARNLLFSAYQLVDFTEKVSTIGLSVGIESAWSLPFMNTVRLLLSGCIITWSHHYLMIDDIKSSLAFTIGLVFSNIPTYRVFTCWLCF
ncbi:Cytochrome c oxidase subunit III [Anaplasma phagocytophilum]|uniref:Cytochrome c oxidase subunit III n=1 Tax=Anaplasma phagocytophilum TaxID=948 RepID=A0AA45USA1_ANAPH|nr:cytochrome c oxidase subunit 3 [Anaplasma phagocytophilum]SBO13959.1 Cytochrome c oxidase subunit III [Anaplasma phagocytophilum]